MLTQALVLRISEKKSYCPKSPWTTNSFFFLFYFTYYLLKKVFCCHHSILTYSHILPLKYFKFFFFSLWWISPCERHKWPSYCKMQMPFLCSYQTFILAIFDERGSFYHYSRTFSPSPWDIPYSTWLDCHCLFFVTPLEFLNVVAWDLFIFPIYKLCLRNRT